MVLYMKTLKINNKVKGHEKQQRIRNIFEKGKSFHNQFCSSDKKLNKLGM